MPGGTGEAFLDEATQGGAVQGILRQRRWPAGMLADPLQKILHLLTAGLGNWVHRGLGGSTLQEQDGWQ
jgi:hypothetical protein